MCNFLTTITGVAIMCQTHLHTWNTTSFPHIVLNLLYLVTTHHNNVYVNNTIQNNRKLTTHTTRRQTKIRGGGRQRREAVWGKTKKGNLWVAAALNGGRPLEGMKGDSDEKLCEGKPKKGREPVGGWGAQLRKVVGRGGGRQRREAV